MFPPFITLYTNSDNLSEIYFFRGLDNDGKWIYQAFNEENMPPHTKNINSDGSIIYTFETNEIKQIKCNLVNNNINIIEKSKLIKMY